MAVLDPHEQPVEATPPPVPRAVPIGTSSVSATARPVAARLVPVKAKGGPAFIREHDDEEKDFTEVAIENSPPWLISAVLHMALLIVLGMLVVVVRHQDQVELEVDIAYAEQIGEQLEFDSPLGKDMIETFDEPILAPDDLPEMDDPFAVPTVLEIQPDGTMATSDIAANQIGLALDGRQEGSKRSLLGRYGGNKTTETAVQRGLAWLARNQSKNGSWSLAGPYDDGVPRDIDNAPAATAMALLAFQGAGNTHNEGKFKKNVQLGWQWLLDKQDSDGNFFHEGLRNHRYYTQGQCTIAVCELYGMTKDPKYKEPAELAVQNCLNAQSPGGGWRYDPRAGGDVSVSGWVVMALQSARMAGIKVPEDHFNRVTRFLDVVSSHDGSRYAYQRSQAPSLAMTAEAILMRQYIGSRRDNPAMIEGMEWITSPRNLVDFKLGRNVYYWYYATQAAHHMEGAYWKRWNKVMRQVLPEQQIKRGRENGSWDPMRPTMDQWAPYGGRLYVTCLTICMLEVYYRHLPIYTKVYTKLKKSWRTDGQ